MTLYSTGLVDSPEDVQLTSIVKKYLQNIKLKIVTILQIVRIV